MSLKNKSGIYKISQGNKNKKRQLYICPFCNKIGGGTAMKRWHFDNCKQKYKNESN